MSWILYIAPSKITDIVKIFSILIITHQKKERQSKIINVIQLCTSYNSWYNNKKVGTNILAMQAVEAYSMWESKYTAVWMHLLLECVYCMCWCVTLWNHRRMRCSVNHCAQFCPTITTSTWQGSGTMRSATRVATASFVRNLRVGFF